MKKKEQEKRIIDHFLEYYNETKGAHYWDVREPDVDDRESKQPDYVCRDAVTGEEIVVEITQLPGPRDPKWTAGAREFLRDLRSRLEGELPGTFVLVPDVGVERIEYRQATREPMLEQLCQGILNVAPTLTEGESATLSQPFLCKLRKLRVEGSRLLRVGPTYTIWPENDPETKMQFQQAIYEANEKFMGYSSTLTILLVGIWETGCEYGEFAEILPSINRETYPNVKHIYLYDDSARRPYHLWPRSI